MFAIMRSDLSSIEVLTGLTVSDILVVVSICGKDTLEEMAVAIQCECTS